MTLCNYLLFARVVESADTSDLKSGGATRASSSLAFGTVYIFLGNIKNMPQRLTTEIFIQRASIVHNHKYDYSLVDYVNGYTKVKIICKKHGAFEQKGNAHLRGHGCKKCQMLDAESFLMRARQTHGNKYSYELVTVFADAEKVKIICPKHGIFKQQVGHHLRGAGCRKCQYENLPQKLSKTTANFIEQARYIHGNKYDYSLVVYINGKTKVKIICPLHGVFEQQPSNHLYGNGGCKQCMAIKLSEQQILTQEEFIARARLLHNDKYDYSQVEYQGVAKKIKIGCPVHGFFEQNASNHIFRGNGCKKCAIAQSAKDNLTDANDFLERIKKIHGSRYDYSEVDYKGTSRKVKIICREHGVFWQGAGAHLKGSGCQQCAKITGARSLRTKTAEFLTRAAIVHGNKYDYSLVQLKGAHKKIKIICPKHGLFRQEQGSHLRGNGCPSCKMSKGEQAIKRFLDKREIRHVTQKRYKTCKDKGLLPFDFEVSYCGKKYLIEYNGAQHYKQAKYWKHEAATLASVRKRDRIKKQWAKQQRLPLLVIPYWKKKKIAELVSDFITYDIEKVDYEQLVF